MTGEAVFIKTKQNGGSAAEIRMAGGVPRLYIDGEATAPVLFFGNTDVGTNVTEQAALAAQNGIHLHSVIYNLHFEQSRPITCLVPGKRSDGAIPDLRRCLDAVIGGDPEAKIFLRVKTGAYFKKAPEEWKDELIVYADGSVYPEGSDICLTSTSSDKWADEAEKKLREIVGYMLSSPEYKDHIACVHLENCEWFEYGFRESGSDMSPCADRKFAEWQRTKYGPEHICVPVPRDLPNNISSQLYKNTLLLEDGERRFVDYFDFINELVSSRIERFARAVKEASDGRLLVIAFYGYLFELADCQSGHYNMRALLRSKYLDGFAGPVSYGDRTGSAPHGSTGATSAYMTAMDSVMRRGKLWFQESDQRTSINNSPDGGWLPNLTSVNDIFQVHRREVGDVMLHGGGIWMMDLLGSGWLYDGAIWKNIASLKAVYDAKIAARAGRPRFDVVFAVDEAAESVVGQPSFCGISGNLLSNFRYEVYRSGVSFAFAELSDVAEGLFDDASLIFILNPYRISHEIALKLAGALKNKNAVFMYGFGATSPEDVGFLTGMDIRPCSPGTTEVIAEGGSFKTTAAYNSVTHRWEAKGGYTSVLGRYMGGEAALAVRRGEAGNTYYYGATSLSRENIRAFAADCGIHIYSDCGDVTVTDGSTLIYCASEAGEKKLYLKENRDVRTDAGELYPALPGLENREKREIKFSAGLGETIYFYL